MNDVLSEAVVEIRDELGTDVYVFIEGDERHFLGDPVTLGVAGWIVSTFFTGFTGAAKGDVEALGRRAYTWLRDGVKSLFASNEHADLDAQLAEARRAAAGHGDVTAYAQASDAALRAALEEYGLDWASAERAAARAREAGLKAIGA